jgi:hypothetical protein
MCFIEPKDDQHFVAVDMIVHIPPIRVSDLPDAVGPSAIFGGRNPHGLGQVWMWKRELAPALWQELLQLAPRPTRPDGAARCFDESPRHRCG